MTLSTIMELAGFVLIVAAVAVLAGCGWALAAAGVAALVVAQALDGVPVKPVERVRNGRDRLRKWRGRARNGAQRA